MGRKVYLDNAATTPVEPEVARVMADLIANDFGNPSSTHSFGRAVKGKLETARRTVARLINAQPGEIIFTSGGTEADNTAIMCSVRDLGVERIITSPIEHHAVLHTVEHCGDRGEVKVDMVHLDDLGFPDLNHLRELLTKGGKTLVSLMHANNEIGNLLSLKEVGEMCREAGALFHSDTVQTMGHYRFDTAELPVDFLTCAAHKLHGPKGAGFLYVRKELKLKPLIYGGSQEADKRAGTENIYGIAGLAKAMELAYRDLDEHREHITSLKKYLIDQLNRRLPGVEYNGGSADLDRSLYTVLNVRLPETDKADMLLFNLDIMGVAVSGGSACSSGSNAGSHVLRGIGAETRVPSMRFSFSRFNTEEEIDIAVDCLVKLYGA